MGGGGGRGRGGVRGGDIGEEKIQKVEKLQFSEAVSGYNEAEKSKPTTATPRTPQTKFELLDSSLRGVMTKNHNGSEKLANFNSTYQIFQFHCLIWRRDGK